MEYTFFFHDEDVIHMYDCENALYWVGLEPNSDLAALCHAEVRRALQGGASHTWRASKLCTGT